MKTPHSVSLLAFFGPIVTLAQDTVTVSINTGTCAAPYATGISGNSLNDDTAGRGGNPSVVEAVTALPSSLNGTTSDPNGVTLSPTFGSNTTASSPISAPYASATTDGSVTSGALLSTAIASTSVTSGGSSAASSAATTISTVTPSAPLDLSGFLLRYSEPSSAVMQPIRARQQSSIFAGYVTPSGLTSANCRDSMVYSLGDNGVLSTGDEGAIFSTSIGVVYQRFNASTDIQNIYAVWQVSNKTVMWNNEYFPTLEWNNRLFSNNTALFCAIHGGLRAYFLFPPQQDCIQVSLGIIPLNKCTTRLPPSPVPGAALASTTGSSNTTTV